MSADGKTQHILGGYDRYETEPSWSHDGSRVVYWSLEIGLAIVPRGGGGLPVPLNESQSESFSARPAWSPDGKTQHILGGYDRYETEPSWSHDGSRVVYWSLEIGLAIVPRGGGGLPVPLNKSQSESFSARPAWSPDGRSILFNGRSAVRSIMSIAPESGSARVLIEQGSDAAWSPDGKRIAFVRVHAR